MTSSVIRTAVVTSLVTAITVSALAVYALPRLSANSNTNDSPYTLQPTMASAPAQDYSYAAPPMHGCAGPTTSSRQLPSRRIHNRQPTVSRCPSRWSTSIAPLANLC